MLDRPSWNDYFFGLAIIASLRSHDAETKHGTIITTPTNLVIGTGYNGFKRGQQDELLPNTRPEKYQHMIHSERNAVDNCIVRPGAIQGVRAYVTGQCCNDCITYLHQNGIYEVYMMRRAGTKLWDTGEQTKFNNFCEKNKMRVVYVTPNLTWLEKISSLTDGMLGV